MLDLGCGDGELLAWLAEHKDVDARGVELSGPKVQRAIARGVSVYQGDIEEALADFPIRLSTTSSSARPCRRRDRP